MNYYRMVASQGSIEKDSTHQLSSSRAALYIRLFDDIPCVRFKKQMSEPKRSSTAVMINYIEKTVQTRDECQ